MTAIAVIVMVAVGERGQVETRVQRIADGSKQMSYYGKIDALSMLIDSRDGRGNGLKVSTGNDMMRPCVGPC